MKSAIGYKQQIDDLEFLSHDNRARYSTVQYSRIQNCTVGNVQYRMVQPRVQHMNIKNKIVFCRLVQVAHPNVLVLVEHIARELNFAEYLVSRANKGKKCRAPVRSHYQTLKKDTERLQEMYLKGEVLRGTMGYLKQMGYLSHRVQEESKRLKGITRKIEDDIENIPEAAA